MLTDETTLRNEELRKIGFSDEFIDKLQEFDKVYKEERMKEIHQEMEEIHSMCRFPIINLSHTFQSTSLKVKIKK